MSWSEVLYRSSINNRIFSGNQFLLPLKLLKLSYCSVGLSLRSDITFATEIRLAVKEIHWNDGLHCKFIVYCNQFSQLLNVSCLLASLWPTRTHVISLSSVLLVYWYLVGSARTISSLFNLDDVIKQTFSALLALCAGNSPVTVGGFTGHWWIPLTKASDADLWCFLWFTFEQTIEWTVDKPVIRDNIALTMKSL